MSGAEVQQLDALRNRLRSLLEERDSSSERHFSTLAAALERVARSWSGSSIGYHAMIYYENFGPPPPGAHFSAEWGLTKSFVPGTSGSWREYDAESVKRHIANVAGSADLSNHLAWADRCDEALSSGTNLLRSIFSTRIARTGDEYLAGLLAQVGAMNIVSVSAAGRALLPVGSLLTRDPVASSQGLRLAPHQEVLAEIARIEAARAQIQQLSDICRYSAEHISRVDGAIALEAQVRGSKVFIGHGRSKEWMKLKNFIQDRLGLLWDEFNRVPVAGQTNIARLKSMLDDASFAFVIMTAEDEAVDGTSRARENVVHEVGLFQGRLGFDRAIVLLEESCNEFSNISGLGQIRFRKDSIENVFEEIRRVLERENVIPVSGS